MTTPVKVAPTTRRSLARMDEYIAEALDQLSEIQCWVKAQTERNEFSATEKARLGRLSNSVAGLALALAQLSRLVADAQNGKLRE